MQDRVSISYYCHNIILIKHNSSIKYRFIYRNICRALELINSRRHIHRHFIIEVNESNTSEDLSQTAWVLKEETERSQGEVLRVVSF